MNLPVVQKLIEPMGDSLRLVDGGVRVVDRAVLRNRIDDLARESALGMGMEQAAARFLIRSAAAELGIFPASIHDLYMARGRGEVPSTFTVPAMNLRALSYHAACAVFRVAAQLDAAALIFEIARSEIGYTDQRPAEYASSILAAAIREGYQGPVFIQGDHFQVSAKRYTATPEEEVEAVKSLAEEAITAGFFNIDVDTSTLVDLSHPTVTEQQELNSTLSANITRFIRSIEPEGVTISVGGEIGEVGGHNSTEEELRAYMDRYNASLGGAVGLSKISIQTGTSHGGVVLPDGSIAEINVDFDALYRLSQVARAEYGLAGAVQHGASTLPEEAFGKFADSEACEVHLATNFQTMMYDRLPDPLRKEIYAYLDKNHANERKPDWTDEQFYYKTQKQAIGPFKSDLWNQEEEDLERITSAWEKKFHQLFSLLRVSDTRKYVRQTITATHVPVDFAVFAGKEAVSEDTSDLAD